MNRRLRVLLFLFIGLSIVGLLVAVFVSSGLKEVKIKDYTIKQSQGSTIDKVKYSGTRAGRLEWELEADKGFQVKGKEDIELTNVVIHYYMKSGVVYIMKGREGKYNAQTEDILIKGDVTVSSKKGDFSLKTDRLRYSAKGGRVWTKGRFRMTSTQANVTGRGLEMNMVNESFKVLSEVRTVFKENII
jgi:LPS export ABC transporter protein LptC